MPPLILCVEDEPHIRALIAEELRDNGYNVLLADNGSDALKVLSNHTPDLILCDVDMPDLNGLDFLQEFRRRFPNMANVPFVFLSALADRADVISGKQAGADDYLTKPIDLDVLLATVEARLRQVARMRDSIQDKLPDLEAALSQLRHEDTHDALSGAAEVLNQIALGIVLIGANRKVIFVNRTATEIANGADGLTISNDGFLRGATAQQTQEIRELIERALEVQGQSSRGQEGAIAISRDSGRRSLALLVSPLRSSAAARDRAMVCVFISDPERRPRLPAELVARLYNLTPAETRLALALAEGKRLDEIAASFGVTRNTLTYTLGNLFRKTQTDRQTDLISLFLGSPLSFSLRSETGDDINPRKQT
ncbi:response regulator [Microvirga roseola]|uniref:response regulator n=1 Tax=Microvirga roseola TaxID=2883126 RepID=UPI001E3E5AE8|nr:response regulator [Microvirga roseola]